LGNNRTTNEQQPGNSREAIGQHQSNNSRSDRGNDKGNDRENDRGNNSGNDKGNNRGHNRGNDRGKIGKPKDNNREKIGGKLWKQYGKVCNNRKIIEQQYGTNSTTTWEKQ